MENKLSLLCMQLAIVLAFTACNNDDDVNIEDYDEVYTTPENSYWEENDPSTYYLLPEVRWLEDEDGTGNSNPLITRDYDDAIIEAIEENMDQLGYTKVETADENNPPDLVVGAQAFATTFEDVSLIWDDYYNWWGFYDPFYPYYPGGLYPVYYNYTTGTVVIEMGDGKSLDVEEKSIDLVWGGAINGLARGSQEGNVDFITDKIDEAFNASSSFLSKN